MRVIYQTIYLSHLYPSLLFCFFGISIVFGFQNNQIGRFWMNDEFAGSVFQWEWNLDYNKLINKIPVLTTSLNSYQY